MSGLSFSETMTGPFALSQTDPASGARAGSDQGKALSLSVTITIPDLDAFLKDPEHKGELTGAIAHPDLNGSISGGNGIFKLFSPGEEKNQKEMVYELPVQIDGVDHYLVGKKLVQNDPGFDLWSDTTTLYTLLYKGSTAEGDPVGAGELRLGVKEQIQLFKTLQATDASRKDQGRTIACFLKFFLDELRDSYVDTAPHYRAKMTRWYSPRLLIRAGSEVVLSSIFGRYADQRLLQAVSKGQAVIHDYTSADVGTVPVDADFEPVPIHFEIQPRAEMPSPGDRSEIWFDYIADTGDGWESTYTLAYLLAQPELEIENGNGEPLRLPRGELLIFGGDQVYPSASPEDYEQRLVGPFRDAFSRPPSGEYPDVFAIPGNHDWYDGLISFSRIFCSSQRFAGPVGSESLETEIGCLTPQRRSYFVLRLPHHWWVFGTDVQLGSDIDGPQLSYFRAVAEELEDDAKVIFCVAEPYWLYPKRDKKKLPRELKTALDILGEVLGDRLYVYVAGDVHHYKRYQSGERHKITAGGGGAFLHPTHGPWPDTITDKNDPKSSSNGFAHQKSFPEEGRSKRKTWCNFLFPFLNPGFGIFTAVVYLIFALMLIPAARRYREADLQGLLAQKEAEKKQEEPRRPQWHYLPMNPARQQKADFLFRKKIVVEKVETEPGGWFPHTTETVEVEQDFPGPLLKFAGGVLAHEATIPDPFQSMLFLVFTVLIGLGVIYFTDLPEKLPRILFGGFHFLAHYVTCFVLVWLGLWFFHQTGNGGSEELGYRVWWVILLLVVAGWFFGSLIMGGYLLISLNLFGRHWNEAFSGLRIEDDKCFLRFHIDANGSLHIYPIGVEKVGQDWAVVPVPFGPRVVPKEPLKPVLIEDQPVTVAGS